jgi:hypothetical protein
MEESDEVIEAALSKVCDERTFISFLGVLAQDWEDDASKSKRFELDTHGPSINGWENGTIGAFLEAANGAGLDCLAEADGVELSVAEVWQRAALIIARGKSYE